MAPSLPRLRQPCGQLAGTRIPTATRAGSRCRLLTVKSRSLVGKPCRLGRSFARAGHGKGSGARVNRNRQRRGQTLRVRVSREYLYFYRAGKSDSLLQHAVEPSPGFSDGHIKLRPQRWVYLETLIEVPPRFFLAPLLYVANATIEESHRAARIERERQVVIVHRPCQIAVRAARVAAIAVGRGVAWIQLDGARVVRNGGGVIAFRVSGGAAVGPCAPITRGKQNGLIIIGQSFFVPAFVTPGVTAIEAHLDITRIEFDGAVEVAQGGVPISGPRAAPAP